MSVHRRCNVSPTNSPTVARDDGEDIARLQLAAAAYRSTCDPSVRHAAVVEILNARQQTNEAAYRFLAEH